MQMQACSVQSAAKKGAADCNMMQDARYDNRLAICEDWQPKRSFDAADERVARDFAKGLLPAKRPG